jgi:hypothetical protein
MFSSKNSVALFVQQMVEKKKGTTRTLLLLLLMVVVVVMVVAAFEACKTRILWRILATFFNLE